MHLNWLGVTTRHVTARVDTGYRRTWRHPLQAVLATPVPLWRTAPGLLPRS